MIVSDLHDCCEVASHVRATEEQCHVSQESSEKQLMLDYVVLLHDLPSQVTNKHHSSNVDTDGSVYVC